MTFKTQLYRNSKNTIFKDKDSALTFLRDVAIKDASIKDGEPFLARYYDENGIVKTLLATAYVDGDVRSFTLASEGAEKIDGQVDVVQSDTEPEDKTVLWLQPQVTDEAKELLANDESVVYSDIRSLYSAIAELTKLVNKHEYAFEQVMDSGTIENSERINEKDSTQQQTPDIVAGTTPKVITTYTSEQNVASVINYYVSSTVASGLTIDQESGWTSDYKEDYYTIDKPYMWNYKVLLVNGGENVTVEPSLISVFDSGSTEISSITDYYYASESEESATPEKTSDLWSTSIPPALQSGNTYLWYYTVCNYEYTSQVKPSYEEYSTPNLRHLLIKSAESEAQIQEHIKDILVHEMIFCEANNGLYMKTSKGKLVRLNGTSDINNNNNTDSGDNNEIMDEIKTISGGVSSMTFVSTSGYKYNAKMSDDGELKIYSASLDTPISGPTGNAAGNSGDLVSELFLPKLYINSFFCGGNDSNEHDYKYCSHNYVELSNLTDANINLNGLYLYYSSDGAVWDKLPLWGEIKKGNTFLIRGSQCSVMESDTTLVKVRDYDMEWVDNGKLLSFANDKGAFYLSYDGNAPTMNPYQAQSDGSFKVLYGYIDLVGFGEITAYEKSAFKLTSAFNNFSEVIMRKYYTMDNVSQATKSLDKRGNATDWYYIDLRKEGVIPYKDKEVPGTVADEKNLFYNKSAFSESKPTMVNVSFGIQATDNGAGATRCFNWVSEGYSDEFLFYRKQGATGFTKLESITEANHNAVNSYESADLAQHYYRKQHEATNGQVFTTHKLIVRGLTAGTYEYYVGKANADGTPNVDACIGLNKFVVRANSEVSSFSFVQATDQQGFNWDEYEVWRYTSDWIKTHYSDVHFMLNTGDLTQNGNRVNEWIDYYNAKRSLKDIEEVTTIGNNDLCPAIEYELGNGGDASKLNAVNIDFFYCYEMDVNNPPRFGVGGSQIYVPSLYSFNYGNVHFMCVNSEITEETEKQVYNLPNNKGEIYASVKDWCERDIAANSGATWQVAYCHEMPFTIITQSVVNARYDGTKEVGKQFNTSSVRGGSHLNTVTTASNAYWFSKFCQTHNIRLVLGGHKHTQSISYPLIETDDSMNPTIQVDSTLLAEFNGATGLTTITSGELSGRKYPNTWVDGSGNINNDLITEAHICNFELVSKITAPVYAMSQSSGYKHTSNKELPSPHIVWLRGYFGATSEGTVVNNGQRAPFFTIWSFTDSKITGNVRKLNNIFDSKGKYSIQIDGGLSNSGSRVIAEKNGFKDGSEETSLILEINK